MITTLFFLMFTSFELVYVGSKQQRKSINGPWLQTVAKQPNTARVVAGVLAICTLILFVLKLGLASGAIAGVITLMAAGSLVVLLQPFNYLRSAALAGLFGIFFLLEIFI